MHQNYQHSKLKLSKESVFLSKVEILVDNLMPLEIKHHKVPLISAHFGCALFSTFLSLDFEISQIFRLHVYLEKYKGLVTVHDVPCSQMEKRSATHARGPALYQVRVAFFSNRP